MNICSLHTQAIRACLVVFICTALSSSLVGCVDSNSIDEPELIVTGETPGIGLRLPPELLTARMVNLNQVRPEVTISNVPVNVTRNGDVWVGVFTLPQTGNNELSVIWVENFEGRDLMLASRVVQINASSPRDITLTNYDSSQFDDDLDGASNLQEREQGSSPFENNTVIEPDQTADPIPNPDPAPTENFVVGNTQSDCRLFTRTVAELFPVTSQEGTFRSELTINESNYDRLPTLYDLGSNPFFNRDVVFPFDAFADREVYTDSISITTAYQVDIEHLSGNPANSVISLHEARADQSINVIAENDDRIGRNLEIDFRAEIEATPLEPGIYCIVMVDREFFNTPNAQIGTPSALLSYSFNGL